MKTLINTTKLYLIDLFRFVMNFLNPLYVNDEAETYFAMSESQLKKAGIPHLVALAICILVAEFASTCGFLLQFIIMLPVMAVVFYAIVTVIMIFQVKWTWLHKHYEEYVDPETGVTRTLVTYEKKRFI